MSPGERWPGEDKWEKDGVCYRGEREREREGQLNGIWLKLRDVILPGVEER